MTVSIFLLVLAFVLLLLAAVRCPEHPRISFAWLGMALWLLTLIIGGVKL
jgi:hypothetical protein